MFDHPSLRCIASCLSPDHGPHALPAPELVFEGEQVARECSVQLRQVALDARAIIGMVSEEVTAVQGTAAAIDSPLLSTGLDSIAATELANSLAS